MNFESISLIVSVLGSAVYTTYILSRRISCIESRMESHIQAYERVSIIEKEVFNDHLSRLDRHVHELRNELQAIKIMMAKELK